jgi:hypothetical protein
MEGPQIKLDFLFAVATGSNDGTDMIVTPVFERDGPSEVTLPVVPLDGAFESRRTRALRI